MKKITLRQLWQDYCPEMPMTGESLDKSSFFHHQPPLEQEQMEKILEDDGELQFAIIAELVEKAAEHREPLDVNFSFNSHILFRNEEEKKHYEAILPGIFRKVVFLCDGKTGKEVGFSVSGANLQAVGVVEQLACDGKADKIVTHFLPKGKMAAQNTENAGYILENKAAKENTGTTKIRRKGAANLTPAEPAGNRTAAAADEHASKKEIIREIKNSAFYHSVEKDIECHNASIFMVSGFAPEELEEDPYIQALFDMGHKVYVAKYLDDETLTVIVA